MSKLSETVERKFIDSITLDDEWEIESDAGWVPVTHIHKTIQYTEWIVITQNNQLICADTHILFDENLNEVFVCDLIPNKSYVMTRTGPELVQELHQTSNQSNMFDITVDSDDHRFYSGEFLSHNTTTSVAYLLWLTLFTDTQTVAVLANKGSLARDILAKYQLAYENLPMWLQQGVVTWNKGNVELENGSKIIAASTSSSAIRGGSFNCVSGKSMTRISVGGKEIEISMEDLYSKITNSSKYTLYDNKKQGCLEYVSREQIQKMVLRDSWKGLFKHEYSERNSSYNTSMSGWNKFTREFSEFANKTPYNLSQVVDENDFRPRKKEIIVCVDTDDSWSSGEINWYEYTEPRNFYETVIRSTKNISDREKTFSGNNTENEVTYSAGNKSRNQRQNIKIQNGSTCGNSKNSRTQKKNINRFNRIEEDGRTYVQDKQESGKNKKNSRKTYWNETFGRIKEKNVRSCQRKNTLEQRYKNEEILILTEEGYKPFYGIKKTENQKTIKLVFDNGQNIICTPEHKIFTKNGYVFAKDCLNLKCLGHDGNFCGVHTITENESIDVYDLLEVQDTHSYYCNDILVHQCVFLDEFGFVPNNIAEEFFNSVYPVISSGKTSKIIIVSTPNGMNLFYKLWMDAITGKNNYKTFEIHWSMVPGRDESWKEETIRNTSERQFSQEFECEFLGSSNTLISGRKLQQIAHRDPSFVHDMVRIYESPVKEDGEKNLKDHLYCIMVDVAEGKGLDSSAFQVIDMTAMPYRQVAAYSSSSISPILFPTVIYNTARMYNDAYILVEVNNTNQIAETLHADFEYENLWKVHTGNKKPQQLSTGFARGVQMGVKMSPQVKRIGCTNLRSLVEADKLILQDFNTYSELTTFIAQKNSWSAESGANDDMVMCLVMFAWVTTQKYFREIVNHDIRKQMQLENMNQIDEITPPEMIVEDGLSHSFAVMGGDVWEDAHSGGTYQNWVNDALKQF
jgi:hypothetical protein